MGKLIVIEGLDGCGKSTQLELLKEKMDAHFISFPYYDTDSGKMISAYLRGDYNEPDPSVSAYSASIMYAADRYTSYRTHWKALYDSDKPVISARYVSSNAIYQMTKLPETEWDSYLEWLCDLEYVKLGMPKPDLTILLDMPAAVSDTLLMKRYNGDDSKRDIHERDHLFQDLCRRAAYYTADKFGWQMINCCDPYNELRSKSDINSDICACIRTNMNK